MKAVIIACSEVKPQGALAGQEFSQIDVCQGRVFCDRSYVGVTLTARRKVLLYLVPHLIGAHPLNVELVGDALDGDLHFRYLGAVKGLSVASEGLLRGDILEMPFMLWAGTFRLMFQRVLDLSIVIFRCRSTLSYRIARRPLYWLSIVRASSGRVTMSYSRDMSPMWYEASASPAAWITRL